MKTAALTGGIGSGKSQVLEEFAQFPEVQTVQADQLAKEIYEPENPHFQEVLDLLGEKVLDKDGKIDLKEVLDLIFSRPRLRRKLENIAHPYVRERLEELEEELGSRGLDLLVVEIPLLFQSSSVEMDNFDWVILVSAGQETRVERLTERDSISPEEARERIRLQSLPDGARESSDFVIPAEGAVEETRRRARDLALKLLE